MNFHPYTEEELSSSRLFPKGVYDFHVMKAEEQISKNGNPMIRLELQLINEKGETQTCFDYLLEAMAYKLRHFCAATALIGKYDKGQLEAQDCVGKKGKAEVGIQEGKQKPDGGYYADKNNIVDYIFDAAKTASEGKADDFYNDAVPF